MKAIGKFLIFIVAFLLTCATPTTGFGLIQICLLIIVWGVFFRVTVKNARHEFDFVHAGRTRRDVPDRQGENRRRV